MAYSIALAILVLYLVCFVFKLLFGRRSDFFRSLEGKHVLLTDGSQNIGLAIAKRCLLEGAFVTLLFKDESNLLKARNALTGTGRCISDQILLKVADVTDSIAVTCAIQDSFRWRPVDILICNAMTVDRGMFDEMKIGEFEKVTRANFMGAVYTAHAAIPLMKRRSLQNPSAIVFMSSIYGMDIACGVNLHVLTKKALKGLADMLRFELMPYSIRVQLVCPGSTEASALNQAESIAYVQDGLKKLVPLCDRDASETADDVAMATVEGVKKGHFLVTTGINGFLIGVMGRGLVPAESFVRAAVESILVIPLRLLSIVMWAPMLRNVRHEGRLSSSKKKNWRASPLKTP